MPQPCSAPPTPTLHQPTRKPREHSRIKYKEGRSCRRRGRHTTFRGAAECSTTKKKNRKTRECGGRKVHSGSQIKPGLCSLAAGRLGQASQAASTPLHIYFFCYLKIVAQNLRLQTSLALSSSSAAASSFYFYTHKIFFPLFFLLYFFSVRANQRAGFDRAAL